MVKARATTSTTATDCHGNFAIENNDETGGENDLLDFDAGVSEECRQLKLVGVTFVAVPSIRHRRSPVPDIGWIRISF